MKKFLVVCFSVLLAGPAICGKYILVHISKEDIPEIVFSNATQTIDLRFKDDALNELFSSYAITVFQREFPGVENINHPRANFLSGVFRIEAMGKEEPLFNALRQLNSSVITEPFLLSDPIPLTTPNDYFNVCNGANFNPSLLGTCVNNKHLELINARQAWDISKGDPNIVIGITDIDYNVNHEDLSGKILSYPSFPGNGAFNYHGNSVAGLAAGATDNIVGLSSIGYNCKLRLYNIGYPDILQAAMDGCRVINCSWIGSCTFIPFHQDIIDLVYDVYHCVIVAGAGNGPASLPNGQACGADAEGYVYPASYNHVISVSSVGYIFPPGTVFSGFHPDIEDRHDEFLEIPNFYAATHNDKVDLCAPGYNVPALASVPQYFNNGYGLRSGTSFATPMVSGLAALVLSANPSIPPDDVERILKCSARDLMEIDDNMPYAGKLGAGRIDAAKALELAQSWAPGVFESHEAPSDLIWLGKNPDGTYSLISESGCPSPVFQYNQVRVVANVPYTGDYKMKWPVSYRHAGSQVFYSIKYTKNINYIDLFRGIDYEDRGLSESLIVSARYDLCTPSNYYSETANRFPDCFTTQLKAPLSIEEGTIVTAAGISVYPNPAIGTINIRLNKTEGKISSHEYVIKNNMGQIMARGMLTTTPGSININKLRPGVYAIQIRDMQEIFQTRFVVAPH